MYNGSSHHTAPGLTWLGIHLCHLFISCAISSKLLNFSMMPFLIQNKNNNSVFFIGIVLKELIFNKPKIATDTSKTLSKYR